MKHSAILNYFCQGWKDVDKFFNAPESPLNSLDNKDYNEKPK